MQSATDTPTSSGSNLGPLHVIDQVILDIARKFRFTVAEVKEYYDKTRDMERTKAKFKKMREQLSSMGDSD